MNYILEPGIIYVWIWSILIALVLDSCKVVDYSEFDGLEYRIIGSIECELRLFQVSNRFDSIRLLSSKWLRFPLDEMVSPVRLNRWLFQMCCWVRILSRIHISSNSGAVQIWIDRTVATSSYRLIGFGLDPIFDQISGSGRVHIGSDQEYPSGHSIQDSDLHLEIK